MLVVIMPAFMEQAFFGFSDFAFLIVGAVL